MFTIYLHMSGAVQSHLPRLEIRNICLSVIMGNSACEVDKSTPLVLTHEGRDLAFEYEMSLEKE